MSSVITPSAIQRCDDTWHPLNILGVFAGWLITAVAATLGAPFWFDLLSKLVKLRGSGPRIDGDSTKGGGAADQKPSMLSTSAAPASGVTQREAMSDALNEQEQALSTSDIERIHRALQPFGAQVSSVFDGVTRDVSARSNAESLLRVLNSIWKA